MTDEPQKLEHRERKRFGPGCFVASLFTLIIYILSPPFVAGLFGDWWDSPVYQAIYFPLNFLEEEFQIVREFYSWYFAVLPLPWLP